MKFRVYAIIGATVLLAAGLAIALIPKSSNASPGNCVDGPIGGVRLPLTRVLGPTFRVSAELPTPPGYGGGSATISVRRFDGKRGTDPNTERSDVAYNESRVVYQEQVLLTEHFAGDATDCYVADWKWSGALSTSDWTGGCVSGQFYSVDAETGDPKGHSVGGWTRWFNCRQSSR